MLDQFTPALRERYQLEIIVSDGGSTDRTVALAETVADKVVLHREQRRQTIAEGRNAGAAAAAGEVFVFLNADTRFENPERFFSILVRTLEDPRVVAATCAIHVFPEEEKPVDRAFHFVHNAYCRFLNLIGDGMARGECHIVRRSVFEALGGYNQAMAAGEDYDLFRRLRRQGKIVFLPGVVLYESPRRFREYGYTRVVAMWTKNALAVIRKNRSDSDHWEPVR